MRKFYNYLILLTFFGISQLATGQFYDGFTGTGFIGGNCATVGATTDCASNGWFTHNGTTGTIDILTGSLTYSGLQASTGGKVYIVGSNSLLSRDINAAVSITGTVAYYSALIKVIDGTNLHATNTNYFMHFGTTSGNTGLTIFPGRLGIKLGSSASNFHFGIMNNSGGTYTENTTDLSFGTTYLIVVKFDVSANKASLWINPASLGGTEPTGATENATSTATITTLASICIRNAWDNTNSCGTPKAEIDEVRVGVDWATVTPTGVATNPVTSITVISNNDSTSISTVNGTLQMYATVLPSNATDTTVTWSIIDGTGHATISTSGLVTAVLSGTIAVRATANDGSGVYGEFNLTLNNQNPPILVSSITVTGAGNATTISTYHGTLQMSASVLPANALNSSITWSVTNGTGTATINSSGLLTASSDGIVAVKASANDTSGVFGTLDITLSNQMLQETAIYDIQYTTDQSGDSPLKDQTVTTSGIVTGKYSGGYYIQDGEGAWNGIFIFDNVNNPSLGDNVTITGLVTEYYKLTEIKTITSYTVNSSSNNLPNPSIVTASQVNTENYEGVLIKLLFGECTSLPDGYKVWSLTDNTGTTKSDDILFSFTPTLNTFYDVVGIGDYSFDNYKILPRSASDISISVKNTEANIVSFYLAEQTGVAVIDTTAKTVSIEVFTGTNVTALVPTIIVSSAATISPASGISQDFTSAKTYTVTAQNTSFTKIWTVTVSVSTIQSSQAEILTFTFPSDTQAGASVINSTDSTVTIEVFPDVNRTNLTPTITNSVFSSISPASGVAKDFSVAQTYVVTAQDGTTKTWTVTVTNQTFTSIYDIQYTTAVPAISPKNDQKVTVKGIVTAVGDDYYQGVTTSFYHIQEAIGAWKSVKVLQENHGRGIGDSIYVTGTVAESYNINTVIQNVTSTKYFGLKNPLYTWVTLAEADSEAYEGVLVTVFSARCNRIPNSYGEWALFNGGDSVLVDDVIYSASNVEVNKYYQVSGVMAHSFNRYRLYPRRASDIVFVEGIEDLNNKNNLQVYPNPVTNKVTISNNSDIQKITLFNILGSKVLEVSPFKSNLIDLDLSNLDKGIYMLNIQYSEKYSETVKIVKQ